MMPSRLKALLPGGGISSIHLRIGQGMFWIVCFVLISRLIGAAREIAIAYRYGVSEMIDAYLLVFTIIMFVPALFASVLQAVLVPRSLRMSEPERREFDAELSGCIVAIGVVLALLAFFGVPILVQSVAADWSEAALHAAETIASAFAPLLLLGSLIGLLTAQLVRADIRSPPLFEAIPGATVMIAVLASTDAGIQPLIVGTLSGLVLQALGLAWVVHRAGALVVPRCRFSSPAWGAFLASAGIIAFGQLLASAVMPIDQLIAARLGEGVVAQFGYASRLVAFVSAILALAVTRAMLPTLSRLEAVQTRLSLTWSWARWLFLCALGAAAVTWLLAPEIVRVLFQRGAFTSADTVIVGEILRAGMFQIPVYIGSIVLIQLLTSDQRLLPITVIAAIGILVKLPVTLVLANAHGPTGIMWANAVMHSLILVLLAATIRVAYGNRA